MSVAVVDSVIQQLSLARHLPSLILETLSCKLHALEFNVKLVLQMDKYYKDSKEPEQYSQKEDSLHTQNFNDQDIQQSAILEERKLGNPIEAQIEDNNEEQAQQFQKKPSIGSQTYYTNDDGFLVGLTLLRKYKEVGLSILQLISSEVDEISFGKWRPVSK